MTSPVPVPSGLIPWCSAWDDTGVLVCITGCTPWATSPVDRSCLDSRFSKPGRYFRLIELRGMMDLALGICPDKARTILDVRLAYGWRRARPQKAAARVLPHLGALRRFQLLQGDRSVWSPRRNCRLRGLAGQSNGRTSSSVRSAKKPG